MKILKIKNKFFALLSSRYLIRRNIRKFVYNSVKNKQFSIVLDVGAGKSPYKKIIKHNKYICLDIENRGNCENLVLIDANKEWPIKDNYADLVLATETLEHIRKPQEFIKEVYRVLRPGGILILTTPFVWPLHEEPNDYFRYTKYGLKMFLKNAGFKFIKIKESNGYCYTMLQLLIINLRAKIFYPFVFLVNLVALLFFNKAKNKKFYLSNFVIAKK